MKIGITGHTHGIGKSTFELLSNNGHTVTGFSRQNGYDIDSVENRNKILKEVEDFDVFINNAFSMNQTTLLTELINMWDGKDKLIINLGSKVTMIDFDTIPANFVISGQEQYVIEKRKQEQIIRDRLTHPLPKLTNLVIGLTDTRMVAYLDALKLDPKHLASTIDFVISNRDFIEVQTMVIDVPRQRINEIKLH
jgi:NADP-dependent 3-hydroxy acid dehydrogenase YdfG